MSRQAIRNEGMDAEEQFSVIIGENAKNTDNQARGDRQYFYNGIWHYVEIKQCQSNTINQVRAIKCIPLVIFSPDRGDKRWSVLSPKAVLEQVVVKERGQHTEIPFECANLSRSRLPSESWCSDAELEARLRAALLDSANSGIKDLMGSLLNSIRELREKYRAALKALLR